MTLFIDYIRLARAYYKADESFDKKSTEDVNRIYNELSVVYAEIKKLDKLDELSSLIDHEEEAVALWASTHCLPYFTDRAKERLKRLSRNSTFLGFDAEMVLKEWEKGRLKV